MHVEISSLQMSPHHIPLRILWQIQEVLNPKHKNEKQQQLSINLLKACDQKKKKSWNSGKNDSQLNYQKQCKPEDSTGLLEVLKNYQPSILYSMYSEI